LWRVYKLLSLLFDQGIAVHTVDYLDKSFVWQSLVVSWPKLMLQVQPELLLELWNIEKPWPTYILIEA
jgi:hypothetical protein